MSGDADVQAAFATVLVDEWARAGVTDAVVAPGSRSTPLLAVLAREPRLRVHVVLDERSAGFLALGIGLATGRPAPVVTTSGTAAVELHPAVVEAHQAGVPLLAVTADRPPEQHDVGAPQTVAQQGLYAGALRWQASPGVPDAASAGSWRSLASRSVVEAVTGRRGPGPVHLNLAFREPLLGLPATLPAARAGGAPWHRVDPAAPSAADGVVDRILAAGRRGLIVAGGASGDPAAVAAAAAALGWPLLADPRSGCREQPCPGAASRAGAATVVAAADSLLRVPELAGGPAWRPEVVLRLGAPWASRVVGEWLAGLDAGIPQFLVDPRGNWADPGRRVSEVVSADPGTLCRALAAAATGARMAVPAPADPWTAQWEKAERAAQRAVDAVVSEPGGCLSEPGLARRVLAAAPNGSTLVVSSSMPVRDVEWYGAPRSGVRVVANRGANGIDGVVSTTLGVALGSGEPTFGLIGDLAFLHDAGALLWAGERELDCTIIVVDNDGGGIFSFLPQAAVLPAVQFERFWATPHRLDIAAVAAAYGVEALRLTSSEQLVDLTARPGESGRAGPRGVKVLVVRTDRAANVAWHDRIHEAVAAAVGPMASGATAGPAPTATPAA